MAIVDDYAGIATELRRIQAERSPRQENSKRGPDCRSFRHSERRDPDRYKSSNAAASHLARRGWTTD